MVTTAIKVGEKKRVDFYMRTGNTRRLLVTVQDRNGTVLDVTNLSEAIFTLALAGGDLTLDFPNGIKIDRTNADGKGRPRVDIEAGYTAGEITQDADYELTITLGGDRDSILLGKARIEASLSEPASQSAAGSEIPSFLDYLPEEVVEVV